MIMEEEYLYICDKQPNACGRHGWREGWTKCENEMCMHTSNIEHAKYKNDPGRKFAIVQRSENETSLFEIVGVCVHPLIKCKYQFETDPDAAKLCTEKDCPNWQLRE